MAKPLYLFPLILALFLEPAIAFSAVASKQAALKTATPAAEKPRPSGAYCGIYCLYTVMKLSGINVNCEKQPRITAFTQPLSPI
jgi:hypothetical protein